MRQITREFENAGNFSIDEVRYDSIVEMCAELDSSVTPEWVDSILFYDWDNAGDHQEWIDVGSIAEIADWVVYSVNSQM